MAPPHAFVSSTLPRPVLTPTSSRTVTTIAPTSALPHFPTSLHPLTSPLRRAQISFNPRGPAAPAAQPSRILLWFHTDLRVVDNPALLAAASAAAVPGGALLPMAAGAATDSRAAPLLAELKHALQHLGSGVVVAEGRVERALVEVCRRFKLDAVYFNRSVLKQHVAMEARVVRALTEAGVQVEAFWGNVLRAPSDKALGGTKQADVTVRSVGKEVEEGVVVAPVAAPERLPRMPRDVGKLRAVREVVGRSGGGSLAGVKVLEGMERERETVRLTSTPDVAVQVKVFLDYGAVSSRMVRHKVVQVMGGARGRTFSELLWREFVSLCAHRAVGLKSVATVVRA